MVKIQEQWIIGTGQRPKNVPFTILSADLNESSLLMDEKKMVKSQTIVRWRGGDVEMMILSTFVRPTVLREGEISAKGWFVCKISQFQDFFGGG